MKIPYRFAAAVLVVTSAPAHAGNRLMPAGTPAQIAGTPLSVTPPIDWNRLGLRPGKFAEIWTLDGDRLNKVVFFSGVPAGSPLFREIDRKNRPLPTVSAAMLATDIPVLLESSYRIVMDTALFQVDAMAPASVGGHDGLRFSYSYTRQNDELRRKGEGRAALVGGKLYMMLYEAPALHFYDRNVEDFHKLADTVKF